MSTLYEQIGEIAGVRKLVDLFYDRMDEDAAYRKIRDLHPEDLGESREKFALFLCGWMGGPGLYVERYGHPRLRARHMPFPIDVEARDQWLHCMNEALGEQGVDEALHAQLLQAFVQVADHMRNR